MTSEEFMERRKNPGWKFNTVVDSSAFLNVNRIHPLKQASVKEIVANAREDANVKRIIIFGSSTRYDCDVNSDLDICVDWNCDCYDDNGVLKSFTRNMRKIIDQVTHGHADILDYGYLDETYIKQAIEDGVIVYVQDV